MNFIADKQTLEDLNIPGRYKNNSISRLFDHTHSTGGSRVMEEMFQRPMTDTVSINQRRDIFKWFGKAQLTFPFPGEAFELMENYLRSATAANLISAGTAIFSKRVLQIVAQDTDYELLNKELCKTIELLNGFNEFCSGLSAEGNPYEAELNQINAILKHPKLSWLNREQGVKNLSFWKLLRYDALLRGSMHEEMQMLMALIYNLDVYLTVSAVALQRGFCYAEALPAEKNVLKIAELYHPGLEHAQGNDAILTEDQNVLFLTGANMAGKSTLMKAIGISLYLAHMGFPVAASQMEFSVKDGLYTSINVPDNINLGYSHFYAEVLRVKKVAEEVAAGRNLVGIFDELFKGTNVKDAYDATLSITAAFSENRDCFFVVSTHIIEVAESLSANCANFRFAYMPTVMEGNVPSYTYQLREGITADRQGMLIIHNEGIVDILNGGN